MAKGFVIGLCGEEGYNHQQSFATASRQGHDKEDTLQPLLFIFLARISDGEVYEEGEGTLCNAY